ncbi:hypothetical protein AURDEDRAFT_124598 [Auricularia subglabra TFB-10046 SS5]|nr:hypothetical protein AURDEDRAFT_124598 [Auricularia subglabra TFB-10046 SS5]
MRASFSLAVLFATAALAQKAMPGKQGTVIVSTFNETSGATSAVGCLTATGKLTGDWTSCATFNAKSVSSSMWDGATLDAGAGACGWDLSNRNGPLMCGPGAKALGFYELDGKLAVQDLRTVWNIDNAPVDTPVTVFWQGLHAFRAVLTWVPN